MCKFKSGVIFKNKVVLAPMYNDSPSTLLRTLWNGFILHKGLS